jgi:tRNA wybutosine-synthesizing protein 3
VSRARRKGEAARANYPSTTPKTAVTSPPQNMAQRLPPSFVAKKQKILEQLAIPAEEYDDLSPKGSIDEGILDLIHEINALDGCVTTSSCAGRISVFLEGKKKSASFKVENGIEEGERIGVTLKGAGVGGKGGGGRWLFVSHDPVDTSNHYGAWKDLFGMQNEDIEGKELLSLGAARDIRFIHFKFEPMVSRKVLY